MGDKKWIINDNVVSKRSWTTVDKPLNTTLMASLLTSKKDFALRGGLIATYSYKLLPQGKLINSKVYFTELTKWTRYCERSAQKYSISKVLFAPPCQHQTTFRNNHTAKVRAT